LNLALRRTPAAALRDGADEGSTIAHGLEPPSLSGWFDGMDIVYIETSVVSHATAWPSSMPAVSVLQQQARDW